jgi:hypothetical protein
MSEIKTLEEKIIDGVSSTLTSKPVKNTAILVLSIIIVTVLSGILGAFKGGEFQRTYDFVSVEMALSEVNFEDPIFENIKPNSRVTIVEKEFIRYDEELGVTYSEYVTWYKGYYKNYFFVSPWYYTDLGTNTLLMIIFYLGLTSFLINTKISKDPVYIKLEEDLNHLILNTGEVTSSKLEPFMDRWNLARKKKQHISNTKAELSKLTKKTSYKTRREFMKIDENKQIIFVVPERKLKWKEKKYLNKKEKIESFLTKEYIESVAPFEKVKYFKNISTSFVHTGNNSLGPTIDEYSNIEPDKKVLGRDLFRKVLLSLSAAAAVTSILAFTLFRAADDFWSILFAVGLRMLPLALQVFLSMDYSNNYVRKQSIPILKYRLNIINLFLKEQKGVETL